MVFQTLFIIFHEFLRLKFQLSSWAQSFEIANIWQFHQVKFKFNLIFLEDLFLWHNLQLVA